MLSKKGEKMKKCLFILFALLTINFAFADECVNFSEVKFVFADKAKGSELLKTEDHFTESLSEFDMSARLKTSKEVSKKEYLNFISQQALDWDAMEELYLKVAFTEIGDLFKKYKILLPKEIYLLKTTGVEEGNSAYCRNKNIIVIPQKMIRLDNLYAMEAILIHEIFHIFSSNNPDVKEKLYNSIGFYKTKDLVFPEILAKKYKITNPDSIDNNYYFESTIDGNKEKVMPILLAKEYYDEKKGGDFFDYLSVVFCCIEENDNNSQMKFVDGEYHIYSAKYVPDYFTLIGENTDYIIHPEEVLADNFVLMVTNSKNIKTKSIIANMKKILKR